MAQLWAAAERGLPSAVEKYLRQGQNPSEHVFVIADVWSRWGTALALGSLMHAEGFSRAQALEALQLARDFSSQRREPLTTSVLAPEQEVVRLLDGWLSRRPGGVEVLTSWLTSAVSPTQVRTVAIAAAEIETRVLAWNWHSAPEGRN
jgi:hypothetical protein